ncbi:MAG: polysaccharide pyruvyl transferase family protein [Verrucomicrobiota bacterium]
MKLFLLPHAGSGNHGCEAIVRSTIKGFPGSEFVLFSNRPGEDRRVGLDEICQIIGRKSRFTPSYVKAFLLSRMKIDKLACAHHCYSPIPDYLRSCQAALSIGGDNYCYGGNNFGPLSVMNRHIRQAHKKFVLWGCSIDPDALENAALWEDVLAFDKVIARESLTYHTLREKGHPNVCLYPDPAFQLDRVDLPLPEGFVEGNTVGINVSPMIIGYEKNPGATLANYIKLIEHILATSDMQVALIPHVVWRGTDDRVPLRRLYDRFAHTGRAVMVEDHPARELKGFIARCRYMVAARTHASIAAYSQSVPTLVVGYSVKARGIARDLFGSEEGYVIPVQSLARPEDLTCAFQFLQKNEPQIKSHYASMLEAYKAKAAEAAREIDALC